MRTDLAPVPMPAPAEPSPALLTALHRYDAAIVALAATTQQRDDARARHRHAEARMDAAVEARRFWEARYQTLQTQWRERQATLCAAFGVDPTAADWVDQMVGVAPTGRTVEALLAEFGTGPCALRDAGESCTHFDCVAEYAMARQLLTLRARLTALLGPPDTAAG